MKITIYGKNNGSGNDEATAAHVQRRRRQISRLRRDIGFPLGPDAYTAIRDKIDELTEEADRLEVEAEQEDEVCFDFQPTEDGKGILAIRVDPQTGERKPRGNVFAIREQGITRMRWADVGPLPTEHDDRIALDE